MTYVIPTKQLNLDPRLTIHAHFPSGIFGICSHLFITKGSVLSNIQATVSVVLFESNKRFDKVSAIYYITDCYLINPEIAARSLPPQNLANTVYPSY